MKNAIRAPIDARVTVCICTYKRPHLLRRLLRALELQQGAGRFTYSIVVSDNDDRESAREVVSQFTVTSSIAVTYCVERDQNIALARNQALAHARGNYIAFIDDDELPGEDWLATMLNACQHFGADGVLGPVRPFFEEPPPVWLVKSKLCERPEYPSGTPLDWRQTRSGNVLFQRRILDGIDPPFRREFGNGGEDQDFFRRLMQRGHRFVWCNEAAVHEVVPQERRRRRYFLKRALRRGQNERRLLNTSGIAKSVLAIPAYTMLIPIACVLGQHVLMDCCVRLLDHVGRLLGAVGIEPGPGKYVGG
jgi:glycosyltransferase involved in cell wall biosynthesis